VFSTKLSAWEPRHVFTAETNTVHPFFLAQYELFRPIFLLTRTTLTRGPVMGDEGCDDNLADATGGAHHDVGLQSIPGPV
jgi:hypothetical protein